MVGFDQSNIANPTYDFHVEITCTTFEVHLTKLC